MKIYIDDIRTPPDATWTVCSNGDEFRAAVAAWSGNGDLTVSFDHDLGDTCPDSGYTLVKWLCEYLDPRMEDCAGNVSIRVHSANPVGAKNIRDYWEWFCEREMPWWHTNYGDFTLACDDISITRQGMVEISRYDDRGDDVRRVSVRNAIAGLRAAIRYIEEHSD